MNRIDNFFKRKLDGMELTPRPESWARIAPGLAKKNRKLILFRAAAALLLLGLLTGSLIWYRSRDAQRMTALPIEVKPLVIQSPTNVLPKVNTPEAENKKEPSIQKVQPDKTVTPIPGPDLLEEEQVAILEKEEEKIEIAPGEVEQKAVAAAPVKKPLVIEYVLEPIPSVKNETQLTAKEGEKRTGLQRALEFAQEAKNSDNPLGGLRQAKDDLFALNFKKDKTKKQ